jgi:hypothetical protein
MVGAPLMEYRSDYMAAHQQEPTSAFLIQEIERLQAIIPGAPSFRADRRFLCRWRKHFGLASGDQPSKMSVCSDSGGEVGEGSGSSPSLAQVYDAACGEADDASADQVGSGFDSPGVRILAHAFYPLFFEKYLHSSQGTQNALCGGQMEVESEYVPAVTASCMGPNVEAQSEASKAGNQAEKENLNGVSPIKEWTFPPFLDGVCVPQI